MMFVDYAKNNTGNAMQVYNFITRMITMTCDIIWLKRMICERLNIHVVHKNLIMRLEFNDRFNRNTKEEKNNLDISVFEIEVNDKQLSDNKTKSRGLT